MDDIKTYTVSEAAAILKMRTNFVYDKCRSGEIKCCHFGRSVRITEAQLRDYLERTAVDVGEK